MNSKKIDEAFETAIAGKVFSGAQIRVGKEMETLFTGCFGSLSFEAESEKVGEDSLFDVASLTKPVVTTTLAMNLVEEGKLSLAEPVRTYLPVFNRSDEILLSHLLNHQSGLPAWEPLFENVKNQNLNQDQIRDIFIEKINQVSPAAEVGGKRIYSDLGFILLGFILEKVSGTSLDKIFEKKIGKSLGLKRSFFNPLQVPISSQEIAATGSCPWRGKTLRGEVHDDNAYVLGGVAGHAGLFSSAKDLEKFIHWFLGVSQGKGQGLSLNTWQRFVGVKIQPKLGWDTVSRPKSQAGQFFSDQTLGHLAFSGCSLWIDLRDQKYFILNTNRIHPDPNNEAIKVFRPMIHDLLIRELGLA